MSHAPKDRQKRREDVLYVTDDEGSSTAGQIAYALNYPLSTVRRDLEALEELGMVRGVKHDERNYVGGRIRVYWSPTVRGHRYIESVKARAE